MEGEKKKEKKETFTWKFMFFYTALFIYVRKICIFLNFRWKVLYMPNKSYLLIFFTLIFH